ncbi:YnfA family protein [Ketogulonicigenium vulgare]|uniref:Putative transmembrane protein n=1 Tax=Ketogulonicigenium vulgare (strain WSH-001) TaxID=759362 RepID=F9Y771_KETVW|nr:YnfA family protein [Ketogulonicigenium vulgare]ADO41271.1 putative membrane protein [Ketogulonicigenium vulgare Y25]AEM42261.1 putative transmembrane protein [Ketogulonicigenium vulgare WSH-001]ALJ79881.1 hypothetical protein KVH_00945 [Ketogulonicigenium vulgare]ANW32784.1 hypothetical protein KvSKV_00955 [Ketogulonicigenium vulgare]AOZ53097.1 conserved hypothetical YnfA/UPF0060 family protein [Ketogulonicigenium vulgare]
MQVLGLYLAAAAAEILGCFAFWMWARLDRSVLWLAPGVVSLAVFAYLLTHAPADTAGRSFAVYGGVYIVASLLWMWIAEQTRPDQWDVLGGVICLIGAAIILWAPRAA